VVVVCAKASELLGSKHILRVMAKEEQQQTESKVQQKTERISHIEDIVYHSK